MVKVDKCSFAKKYDDCLEGEIGLRNAGDKLKEKVKALPDVYKVGAT